jgi:hypothetical protein
MNKFNFNILILSQLLEIFKSLFIYGRTYMHPGVHIILALYAPRTFFIHLDLEIFNEKYFFVIFYLLIN